MKNISISDEKIEVFLNTEFGERMAVKVLEQYGLESVVLGKNAWALHNAITHIATHSNKSEDTKERLMLKANAVAKRATGLN